MKNYQKTKGLQIMTILLFVLLLYLSKYLTKDMLWHFEIVTLLITEQHQALVSQNQHIHQQILKNHYFYYNNRKITYQILEVVQEEQREMLILDITENLPKNIPLTVAFPFEKQSLLEVILENWRSK